MNTRRDQMVLDGGETRACHDGGWRAGKFHFREASQERGAQAFDHVDACQPRRDFEHASQPFRCSETYPESYITKFTVYDDLKGLRYRNLH